MTITTKMQNTVGSAVLMLGLLVPAAPVAAYSWYTCDDGSDKILWEEDEGAACDGCVTMQVSTVSFPPGTSSQSQIDQALDSWRDIERSTAYYSWILGTDGTHGVNNGENEVYSDSIDGRGGVLAVTHLVYNGGWADCIWLDDSNISEADVEFDDSESWYTGTFSYTSSNPHLRIDATHEFGHALGLGHEDRWLARMNSYYPLGGPITRSRLMRPIADDRAGVRYLYPEGGTAKPDLVGSDYKRTGTGTSGLVSGPTSATRGQSKTIEYTIMNIGSASAGSFAVGFYLSTNEIISTGDRLLATSTFSSFPSGSVGTYTRTVTIPTDVATGTYYLGVLIDKDGDVSEWDEGNDMPQPRTVVIN